MAPGPPTKNSILIMSIPVERKCIEFTDDLMLHSHDPLFSVATQADGQGLRVALKSLSLSSYHHVLRLDGTRPINWYLLI